MRCVSNFINRGSGRASVRDLARERRLCNRMPRTGSECRARLCARESSHSLHPDILTSEPRTQRQITPLTLIKDASCSTHPKVKSLIRREGGAAE
eukprot:716636-Pleurochrysis_carterae.AAC.1